MADVNNNIYLPTSLCEVLDCPGAGWRGPRRERGATVSVQSCRVAGEHDGTHTPTRDGVLGGPLRAGRGLRRRGGCCQAPSIGTALVSGRERGAMGEQRRRRAPWAGAQLQRRRSNGTGQPCVPAPGEELSWKRGTGGGGRPGKEGSGKGGGAPATATPSSWVLVLLWMLGDLRGTQAVGRGMFIHQPLQAQGEGCSRGSSSPLSLPQPRGPRKAQRERPAAAVCGEAGTHRVPSRARGRHPWHSPRLRQPGPCPWVPDRGGGSRSCVCARAHDDVQWRPQEPAEMTGPESPSAPRRGGRPGG